MLTIDEALERLARWAESKSNVKCAVLFGSFAMGKSNPRDLDVALVAEFKDLAEEIFTRHDDWKPELRSLLEFQDIDLNMLNDKNPHVVSYVRAFHLVAYDPGNALPELLR